MDDIKHYKLGSLFDGSGGFPLAGTLCGIEPMWAAEVEPYPIAVTRSRFPNMKHLGDISKINGAEIEPVDIITFGSPCQDLSVAGKRAGLKHEANGDEETTRSGLFMEAVRIIKEMRTATNGEYPRFALWENVPGAFSSNNGEDFRIVCEELIKIIEPSAFMPAVPKNGWSYADSYTGDGWSLAYRVFDAQYWGVPQRRRRIHLVADFRGQRACEVLFEREGVRGYFAESGTPWQGIATDAQDCPGADDREGADRNCITPWDVQSRRMYTPDGPWPSLYSGEGGGHGYVVTENDGGDRGRQLDAVALAPVASTLRAGAGAPKHEQDFVGRLVLEPTVPIIDSIGGQAERGWEGTVSPTLKATHYKSPPTIAVPSAVFCLQGNGIDRADTAGCNGKGWKEDTCYTLNTIDRPAVCYRQGGFADYVEGEVGTLRASGGDLGGGTENLLACREEPLTPHGNKYASTLKARDYKGAGRWDSLGSVIVEPIPPRYIVRRLTPTECARLQGFADWWGHIEQKDSLTDEEYRFWLDVRNTHAAINGKKVQDYTEKQMLTWYNKLWTDSAEYKMWGNGIVLPPALYCLQGITDALNAEEVDDEWML